MQKITHKGKGLHAKVQALTLMYWLLQWTQQPIFSKNILKGLIPREKCQP